MNFYFCEACGRRITEYDIEAGAAEDKKLKGVFCKTCAVGVSTMETLPMSDAEARAVLEASKSQAKSTPNTASPLKAHSDSRGRALPDRRGSSTGISTFRRKKAQESEGSRGDRPKAVFIVCGTAVFLSGLLGLVMWVGSERSSTRSSKQKDALPSATSNQTASSTKKNEIAFRHAVPKNIHPDPDPKKELEQDLTTASGTATSEPQPLQETHETKPAPAPPKNETATVDAMKAGDMKKAARNPDKPSKTNSEPKQQAPPEKAAPAAPAPLKAPEPVGPSPADLAMERHLPAICEALAKKDFEQAARLAEEIGAPETFEGAEALRRALSAAIAPLQAREKARLDGLLQLKGKNAKLQLSARSRPQDVQVLDVKDGDLLVKVEYEINKEMHYRDQTYPLAMLPEATWERLSPTPAPGTPDEWTGQALVLLAHKDHAKLGELLPHCEGQLLGAHLKRAWDKWKVGEKTLGADEAWELAEKDFATNRLQEALNGYAAFTEKHRNTPVFDPFACRLRVRVNELEDRARVYLSTLKYKDFDGDGQSFPGYKSYSSNGSSGPRSFPCSLKLEFKKDKPDAVSLTFELFQAFATFEAQVGVEGKARPARFSIFGDGKELWRSEAIEEVKGSSRVTPVPRVDIRGVHLLKLTVEPTKEGGGRAIWAEPCVLRLRIEEPLASMLGPVKEPASLEPKLKVGVLQQFYQSDAFSEQISARLLKDFSVDMSAFPESVANAKMYYYRWVGYLKVPEGKPFVLLRGEGLGCLRVGSSWLHGRPDALSSLDKRANSSHVQLEPGVYALYGEFIQFANATEAFHVVLSDRNKLSSKAEHPPEVLFHDPAAVNQALGPSK